VQVDLIRFSYQLRKIFIPFELGSFGPSEPAQNIDSKWFICKIFKNKEIASNCRVGRFSRKPRKAPVFILLRDFELCDGLQNINSKYFTGKILVNKELSLRRTGRRSVIESCRFCSPRMERMPPVWTFYWLSKGWMSQELNLFWAGLWKTGRSQRREELPTLS